MNQNHLHVFSIIMVFMTIYVLYNSQMYNSILGRTILITTIILLTNYNVIFGLGLLVIIIYMYPDANYLEGLESGTETETGTETGTGTATKPTSTTTVTGTTRPVPLTKPTSTTTATGTTRPEPVTPPASTGTSTSGTSTSNLANKANQMMANIMGTSTTESFANDKPTPKSNDRISKEEHLRPKTSVTTNLYPERGLDVSTFDYQEPSPNESNSLNFSFLS